jgi:hypothetical protein
VPPSLTGLSLASAVQEEGGAHDLEPHVAAETMAHSRDLFV